MLIELSNREKLVIARSTTLSKAKGTGLNASEETVHPFNRREGGYRSD